MTTSASITTQTLFLDAWMQRDDLLDRLCTYNPAFKEFRKVLGHENVAGCLSLADVASMVDSPVDNIAAVAGGQTLPPRPTRPLEYAPIATTDEAPARPISSQVHHLDTRPIFANGNEPLPDILSLFDVAGPADTVVIDVPFHPAPLRRLLARRGYRSEAEELAPDHWRCTFFSRPVDTDARAPREQACRAAMKVGCNVAAVATTGSGPTGLVLTEVARLLQAEGCHLAGVVQAEPDRVPEGPCDMALAVLPDGQRIDITQNLGRHAQGCRLDQQALEDAVGLVERSLDDNTQLLIINKFGRRESEGAGFRQTIARAVELGVPVLIGIGATERAALENYIGEDLIILPENVHTILDWCHELVSIRW